jgi:hypothetical protein
MFRALLAGAVLLAGHVALGPVQVRRQPAVFSIVLESTPTGWAARCDTGCRWHEAAFGCGWACGAVVDANGLVTLATPRPASTPFMFIVEKKSGGVWADSRRGTSWEKLSWSCESGSCRVRLDASGVSTLDASR